MYNNIIESKAYSSMSCDGCGSDNIQETTQGYVCEECGLVLEIERLKYYLPYNKDIVQYATLNTTQIGTRRERLYSPHSYKLKDLHKLHIMSDNQKTVFSNANLEINRILSALSYPDSFRESIFRDFKRVHSEFKPSTKYRSVEKLVPVVLYYSLRKLNVSININQLLEISKIEKSEFIHFRVQVKHYYKQRGCVQRQFFIFQKFLEIKEHFNLEMEFVFHAKKIMNQLWTLIKNTTDNVIAGVSAFITMLCYYDNQMSINAICKLLGIQMSTIQFQVKHQIFESLKVEGFTTLIKCSDILKSIMEQLGLFETKNIEDKVDTIVKVELGNAIQVFNHNSEVDYYLFGLLTTKKECVVLGLKVYKPRMDFNTLIEMQSQRLFELELYKYSHGKDPPTSDIV